MKSAILNLKQEVKVYAADGQAIRRKIQGLGKAPETGPERSSLWEEKRGVGAEARHSLLAYGLLRGVSYKTMESKVREGNEPSASLILDRIHWALGKDKAAEWTLERVTSLLYPVKEAA